MFVQGVPPYTQVPLTWIPLTQFFATLLHQSFSKQLMTFCDAEHSKLSEKEAQMSQGREIKVCLSFITSNQIKGKERIRTRTRGELHHTQTPALDRLAIWTKL